jgi:hypothetical protein
MTKYLLILLFSAGTLFAAQSPIVEIRYIDPNTYIIPPLNLGLGNSALPKGTYSDGVYSSILDGVTFTSASPLGGPSSPPNMLGLKANGIDITFSLGTGVNAITFDDLLSGGGDVDVFYQTGKGPVREVTVAQGNGAKYGGPSAVLFPEAVTNIFVNGATSIEGLNVVSVHERYHHGNVPMVPEANPAPLLGGILLCAVAYQARRRLVKVSAS